MLLTNRLEFLLSRNVFLLLEIEFLDINLSKDSSLAHAIHSPFYWRNLIKTMILSGFKNPYKKSAKQENSSLLCMAFAKE